MVTYYALHIFTLLLSFCGIYIGVLYKLSGDWVMGIAFAAGVSVVSIALSFFVKRRFFGYTIGLVLTLAGCLLLFGFELTTIAVVLVSVFQYTYAYIFARKGDSLMPQTRYFYAVLYIGAYITMWFMKAPEEVVQTIVICGLVYLIVTLFLGTFNTVMDSALNKERSINKTVQYKNFIILGLSIIVALGIAFFKQLENVITGFFQWIGKILVNAYVWLVNALMGIPEASGEYNTPNTDLSPLVDGEPIKETSPILLYVLTVIVCIILAAFALFLLWKIFKGLKILLGKLGMLIKRISESGEKLYIDEQTSLFDMQEFKENVAKKVNQALERFTMPKWNEFQSEHERVRFMYKRLMMYNNKAGTNVSCLTPAETEKVSVLPQSMASEQHELIEKYQDVRYSEKENISNNENLRRLYKTLT